MDVYMLTTEDNPYDPFSQFDEWFAFDERKGYHSCSYLERIAKTANDLSPFDQISEINRAIDEILQYNILGIYKKVVKHFD